MKILIKDKLITDDVSLDGLLTCELKHEIKETKGTLLYTGPKIPPEVWFAVTSFFKWTYDTTKSESQVRLFVSPTQKTWRAWAFPQEAKTGMTARELDNDEAKKQRAELNMNPPEWFYFGTVHHHCGAGAFQSSTDEHNEKDQDGLHITVGRMDEKQFDLHARFYRKGLCFEPDMSWFWEIGNILDTCPEVFRGFIPKNYPDLIARRLMCVPRQVEFPEQWKTNLIEIKPPETMHVIPANGAGYFGGSRGPEGYSSEYTPLWQRAQNAWSEIIAKCVAANVDPEDLQSSYEDMRVEGFAFNIILTACVRHKVDLEDLHKDVPTDLAGELSARLLREEMKEEEARLKKKGLTSGVGPEAEDPYDEWQGYCQ